MLESEGVQPVVGHLPVISAPISLSFHPIPQYHYLYLSCAFPASPASTTIYQITLVEME